MGYKFIEIGGRMNITSNVSRVYKVVMGFLSPQVIPFGKSIIEIGKPSHKGSLSIPVGENWKIIHDIQLFDTLVFFTNGYEVIFQVMPAEDPKYGRLVFIKLALLPRLTRSRNFASPIRYSGSS